MYFDKLNPNRKWNQKMEDDKKRRTWYDGLEVRYTDGYTVITLSFSSSAQNNYHGQIMHSNITASILTLFSLFILLLSLPVSRFHLH
jgi:hypothetical protein